MIHVINITTKTKEGDAYPAVAINEYPIIYINDTDAEHILDDKELIETLRYKIKNGTTYRNATINIRSLDDEYNSTDTHFKLSDILDIPEWRQS